MSIKFSCPHCSKALNVKDGLAGKKRNAPAARRSWSFPFRRSRLGLMSKLWLPRLSRKKNGVSPISPSPRSNSSAPCAMQKSPSMSPLRQTSSLPGMPSNRQSSSSEERRSQRLAADRYSGDERHPAQRSEGVGGHLGYGFDRAGKPASVARSQGHPHRERTAGLARLAQTFHDSSRFNRNLGDRNRYGFAYHEREQTQLGHSSSGGVFQRNAAKAATGSSGIG